MKIKHKAIVRVGCQRVQPHMSLLHPKFGRIAIETGPLGLPVRHVITHGGKRTVGSFPCVKMGRTMPWESFIERALIHRLAFDFHCAGYLVQPHTLMWETDNGRMSYTPDAIAEQYGGITVYEAKKVHPNVYGDIAAVKRYNLISSMYALFGWKFQIVTERQLTANAVRLLNQRHLSRARFTAFGLAEEIVVHSCLQESGGVSPLCTLITCLHDAIGISDKLARETVLAMAARRIIGLDLEKPITPFALVHQIMPKAPSMTILNFWENTND